MSEFNFKSSVCTNLEQSERLLALGLKPETADMKYPCTREYYEIDRVIAKHLGAVKIEIKPL